MTPEQISTIAAIATILKSVGTVPFGITLLFVMIGPWAGMIIAVNAIMRSAAKSTDRSNRAVEAQNERINQTSQEFHKHVSALATSAEKRFEAVVRMYENNVQVVKDYNGLASDLTGIITLSTRTLEGLAQKIDNNQFCPLVRKETGKS